MINEPPQPGSVLADPTPEDLDMISKAYQARLQEGPTPANLDKSYPRADLEIERTKMCIKMVELAQAMFEANQSFNQTNVITPGLHFQGLLERLEQLVNKPQVSLPPQAELIIERESSSPKEVYVPDSIDDGEPLSIQQHSQTFLREIQEEKWAKEKDNPPPILEIDDLHDQFPQDIPSIYGGETEQQEDGRLDVESNSLQELPQFTGPWESESVQIRAPTIVIRNEDSVIPRNTDVVKNTKVQCHLTVEELLKAKPELWDHVKDQVPELNSKMPKASSKEEVPEIPLDKIGDMCEGDEGNTYLPITYQGYTTKAIIDSGAKQSSTQVLVLLLQPPPCGSDGASPH
ncbi:hypothetical protein KP509_07G059100 [Ceratopteris richardii]|uniref:Uncharacterized protein n=1 Tax=Ceratopteris richardii TaxID=49495 RepID=A0A8T2UAB4_CERRI|nr:hypothetical protein KP509_07G059100 [Ceratopteris richardii]